MAGRQDLLLEVTATTDANGDYNTAWVETRDVSSIHVRIYPAGQSGQVYVRESLAADENQQTYTHILGTASGNLFKADNVPIGSRFFRVELDGGISSNTVRFSVRAVTSPVIHGLD